MSILVRITVANPADILDAYGVGALVRLEAAPTEAGAYVEVATEPVVADQFLVTLADPTGTSTTWYRSRYSNALATVFSEYGAAFSPGSPVAYATLDDLLLTLGRRPTTAETDRLARMEKALVKARELIDLELGFDFFRHPASGSESWIVDGPGGSLLHAHNGIASLDSVEVRDSMSGTWTLVDASDWLLEPDVPVVGQPYFHVQLTGVVSRGTWPSGSRLIRFTGARGWPRFPALAVEGNVDWAKMQLAVDPTGQGGPQGPPDLGRPMGLPYHRMPDAVYKLKRWHVEQFLGCGL